jgi:hypothetical protein
VMEVLNLDALTPGPEDLLSEAASDEALEAQP